MGSFYLNRRMPLNGGSARIDSTASNRRCKTARNSGIYALVLESVPADVAAVISEKAAIPVIGLV